MVDEIKSDTDGRPRIVILGGGFGGLNAAKALRGADADVYLVDRQNFHLFQPLLYQVATAGLGPGDIASPIRAILHKQKNLQVILGEVTDIDRANREVIFDTGKLAYDYLIVATGMETNYFGNDRWEKLAPGLKTMDDALECRRRILKAFERAEWSNDPELNESLLTFVIVGAGPTGVEMAGAIREISHRVMVEDFRNIDSSKARVVAIKIFDPDEQLDADSTRAARRASRFKQEAQLVSQLEHPNTVTIYDFGIADDGKAYLVMEFIEGPTLKDILRERGSFEPDDAIPIFLQILRSLEEAHHRNILHRDLKPANIMLTENFKGEQIVKVLDFGIARTVRAETAQPEENSRIFLGTPRYAAPEQFKRDPLTLATDIYGVGALMWHCLLGEPMLASGDIRDCMAHAASPEPWEVPEEAGLPARLADILERAVEKDPSQRYRDAGAMMSALESYADIDREDLPEVKADDGLLRAEKIIDPNITAPDDSENFFLSAEQRGGPPPTPASEKKKAGNKGIRPPSRHDRGNKPKTQNRHRASYGPTSTPGLAEEPLELAEKPRPRSRRQPSRERSHHARNKSTRSSRFSARPFIIVAILIGVAGGAYFLFGDDLLGEDEGPPQSPQIVTTGDDASAQMIVGSAREPNDFMRASRFSLDGITIALRSDGWRVRQPTEPMEMGTYTYYPLTVDRRNLRLDLAIYETRSEEAMEQLIDNREPHHYDVVLDHILARISPRLQESEDTEPLALRLQGFLQSYHSLVSEQGTRQVDGQ